MKPTFYRRTDALRSAALCALCVRVREENKERAAALRARVCEAKTRGSCAGDRRPTPIPMRAQHPAEVPAPLARSKKKLLLCSR
jgi:hypothetical protein